MRLLKVLVCASLVTLFAKHSFAEVIENERIFRSRSTNDISVEIHISKRTSLNNIEKFSEKLYIELGSPDKIWIGYFISNEPIRGAWALTSRNFSTGEANRLSTHIAGFTFEEWESFGRDRGMYPPDADLVGLWQFFLLGSGNTEIAIYKWGAQEYLYHRFGDGSGTPSPITSELHPDLDARIFREPHDEEEGMFWLLTKSGELQRHDREGHIPGWTGTKVDSANNRKSSQSEQHCSVLKSELAHELKSNHRGKLHFVNLISIDLVTYNNSLDDYIAISADVIKQVKSLKLVDFDNIEIRFSDGSGKETLFFLSYTPDPSKLVFADSIWFAPGVPDIAERIQTVAPRHGCVISELHRR